MDCYDPKKFEQISREWFVYFSYHLFSLNHRLFGYEQETASSMLCHSCNLSFNYFSFFVKTSKNIQLHLNFECKTADIKGLFLSFPQAAMIQFLALFDPLFSRKKHIYVTIETPVGSTKYSERKT